MGRQVINKGIVTRTISIAATCQRTVITDKALADCLQVCQHTVAKWRRDGVIPFHRLGKRPIYEIYKVVEALENYNR